MEVKKKVLDGGGGSGRGLLDVGWKWMKLEEVNGGLVGAGLRWMEVKEEVWDGSGEGPVGSGWRWRKN